MEAIDALLTRRSVGAAFLGDPGPSEEHLELMLRAASRVPDHGKLAPWRFILFRGNARHLAGERLAALLLARDPDTPQDRIEQERSRLALAPLVVAVVSRAAPHVKIPEWEQILSAGAAAMTLVHAANALGYGAQWLTDWCAYDAEATRLLGLKPGERFVGFIHIGTPRERPADRPRPPLSEIVSDWSPT